jgi:hypothetical protein
MTMNLKSVRNFAYAALLAASAFAASPTTASAQEEGGRFTMPHEVRWQNVIVPAGEYRFSIQPSGPSELLRLTKVSGTPATFMLLVNDTQWTPGSDTARIVINATGSRYVTAMYLPEFEVALHFLAPPNSVKEVAAMRTAPAAGSAR